MFLYRAPGSPALPELPCRRRPTNRWKRPPVRATCPNSQDSVIARELHQGRSRLEEFVVEVARDGVIHLSDVKTTSPVADKNSGIALREWSEDNGSRPVPKCRASFYAVDPIGHVHKRHAKSYWPWPNKSSLEQGSESRTSLRRKHSG